ncbi:tRNA modification GTPase MnmE [Jannaschia seosinensis]|uniref:tRNA modification GTPase MnmE n=1 Tax=Jannaschia seosinensis TaxID=313367 RepID=A0A0M7BC67_9RHOB|nr:tRNA uridine-5-carboxymethylaminomethyl(34) synthesis GTPase MnmE [Jannaschia seosinensis]CUH39412.1 tRNA modification GTPase MnmE [Jannaschia seosinensis]
MEETIFALATARGKAGLAVIRISGPNAVPVLSALGGKVPAPRSSRLCVLRDGTRGVLDHALVLYFAEGASFTDEDVVELHLHGSIAIVQAVIAAILDTGLARMAGPGEFTRRALMNERLDLTQVQGLSDMIDAETEVQRRHALRVFGGEMSEQVAEWRVKLIRAAALLEATIDFAEEDTPEDVEPEVRALLENVIGDLRRASKGFGAARTLRDGFEVALIGAPNAGKSSLLNRLTGSDAAIVSKVAGTTRDIIEVRMNIDGMLILILDTAGLRHTEDEVESIGVTRARARAKDADLRIFLHEEEVPEPPFDLLTEEDLIVRTKVDVRGGSGISNVTGEGIEELVEKIGAVAERRVDAASLFSRERDRASLENAVLSLEETRLMDLPVEVQVASIRNAVMHLADIIGAFDVEFVLDDIFRSFCIGK